MLEIVDQFTNRRMCFLPKKDTKIRSRQEAGSRARR